MPSKEFPPLTFKLHKDFYPRWIQILYKTAKNIDESLEASDYEDIWSELDRFSGEPEVLRRAYYQILCRDILTCERHVTGVIQAAGTENHVIVDYLKSKNIREV